MRKIKYNKEFKGTNVYCTFCKPLKIKAIYRHDNTFSCDEHKLILSEIAINDYQDDYSEAMYSINSILK